MATPTYTSQIAVSGVVLLLGLFGHTTQSAGTQDQASCNHPNVTDGQPSNMTFYFGRDIDTQSDGFFAYLRRDSDSVTDILRCDRPNPVMPVTCTAIDKRFKAGMWTTNRIIVTIPKTTKGLEDNYTWQIYENSSPQPPILCNLTVTDKKHVPGTQKEDMSWIAAPVLAVLLLSLVFVFVVLLLRKRKQQRDTRNGNLNRLPLLGQQDEHLRKRWFRDHLTNEEEKQLSQSRRTKPGSFLITTGRTNPGHFLLIVFFEEEIKRFPISRRKGKFKFLDTEKSFSTLTELVNYYKEHTIRYGDRDLGTLSKPFRIEPNEDWYFGIFSREDEKKLLKTAGEQPSGRFLIRDGETEPDDYVLAVCFEGEMKHFTVIEEEDGFRFRDTGKIFDTLPDLVKYYKNNDISVGNKNYGKLLEHFGTEQIDAWYLQQFRQNDDQKILKSPRKEPGSFLVATSTTNPENYILAVHFEGVLKRFTIRRERSRYTLVDTEMSFRTLSELINHYKEHDIKKGRKVWGKLSTLFRLEPEEEWFFGKFTRKEEEKLLVSPTCDLGSFLIREGVSDPENYVLSVFADGQINHFVIVQEENGFVLRDVDSKVHTRLCDLVAYYKENAIRVGDREYCTLVKPFVK